MENLQCPACKREIEPGQKFCLNCGCNLEVQNNFVDGARLTSPDKMIPKCVICGTAYGDGISYCPKDGGVVMPEALWNKAGNSKEVFGANTMIGYHLLSAAKWAKVNAIILLILLIIITLTCLIGISKASEINGAPWWLYSFPLLIVFLIFPIFQSFSFSNHARMAVERGDPNELSECFSCLRSRTTFYAVLNVLLLCFEFYGLIVTIGTMS